MGGREQVCPTQANKIDSLPSNGKDDEAKVNPGNEGMCIVSVWVLHVAQAQLIQFSLATATGGIDRKEDWPCDDAANKTDNDEKLEVPKPEVPIKRVVDKDERVWEDGKVAQDAEEARLWFGGSPLFIQELVLGSWSIHVRIPSADEEEAGKRDRSDDKGGNQRRDDAR